VIYLRARQAGLNTIHSIVASGFLRDVLHAMAIAPQVQWAILAPEFKSNVAFWRQDAIFDYVPKRHYTCIVEDSNHVSI